MKDVLITRRQFEKTVLATALGIPLVYLGAQYLSHTELPRQNENFLDFTVLRMDRNDYPQDRSEVQNMLSEVRKDGKRERKISMSYPADAYRYNMEAIRRIRQLRNLATLSPTGADIVAEELESYNKPTRFEPTYDIRPMPDENATNAYYGILKHEAYRALAYLKKSGYLPSFNPQNWSFHPNDSYRMPYSPNGTEYVTLEPMKDFHPMPITEPLPLGSTDQEKNTLSYTEKLVQNQWPLIKKASEMFRIDPFYLAAHISLEARDTKNYLVWGEDRDYESLYDHIRDTTTDDAISQKVTQLLIFINTQPDIVRQLIPQRISEEVTDLAGLFGVNASMGSGQISIETAKRFKLVRLLGKEFLPETDSGLLAALLTNPEINIMAMANYSRKLINSYEALEEEGLNLYLPDLRTYNPSIDAAKNILHGDPLFKEDFGVRFLGGLYTGVNYPEFSSVDLDSSDLTVALRFPRRTNGWGDLVAQYYHHYATNKYSFGLN